MKKMTANFAFLALAISVAPVFAGDADTPPLRLTPTKISNCPKAYVCKNLPYGARQAGKGVEHTNVAQTYDLYLPGSIGEIDRAAPFYLFVHGGAWRHGDKGGRHAKLLAEMAEQGFVAASMNYVLCDDKRGGIHTFAEMLADIDAMVSHLPVLAKAAGISIPRIALGGNSAGGHLALLYAYDGANPSVLGLSHARTAGYSPRSPRRARGSTRTSGNTSRRTRRSRCRTVAQERRRPLEPAQRPDNRRLYCVSQGGEPAENKDMREQTVLGGSDTSLA